MPTRDQVASRLLRSRLGSVCAAITGSSPEELCGRALEVLSETSFLEFRLDYLADPSGNLIVFKEFLAAHRSATIVATCRPQSFGGRFQGTAQQALAILVRAAEAGFQLVDVDLQAAEALGAEALERLHAAGAGVILSDHDFNGMGDLKAIYNRMESFAPDFAKIAVTASSLTDNLTMLRFLQEMEDEARSSLVGICMGDKGVLSRILGLRSGSAFTFASGSAGEETAPGQIAARTLLELYRVNQLDKATRVFGVAGDPIGSSLSPLMLNTAFRRETVNAVYVALSTRDPRELLQLAREIPLGGLSITMPLKQEILPLLERTDPLSAKIGAVNTVLRAQDGRFYGFNTDVAGIVGPLERRLSLNKAKVLVLGAGGAARAAVFGCRDKGAEVFLLNRTPAKAAALAKAAGGRVIQREAVAKAGFDVVINATPAGMRDLGAESLLEPEDLNARFVFDLVYNPLDTPLLKLARQKGLTPISGVEMFVAQGARQFEIWTGKAAPHEEMMRVVLHALRQSEASASAANQPAAVLPPAAPAPPASPTVGSSRSALRPTPAATPVKKPLPPSADTAREHGFAAKKPSPLSKPVPSPVPKPVALPKPATSITSKPAAVPVLKPARPAVGAKRSGGPRAR